MINTIIFDLNGTLVDSERAHWLAYNEVLAPHGIAFPFAEFAEDWTRLGHDLEYTLRRHGRIDLLDMLPDIKRSKDLVFRATQHDRVTLMPGAEQCIRKLASHFTLIVDSTSAKADVEGLLQHVGLLASFTFVTSGDMPWDESLFGKSNKATRFLYIARRLGRASSECLVVGDAEKDVVAARAANMLSIIISGSEVGRGDVTDATLALGSLDELTVEKVQQVSLMA